MVIKDTDYFRLQVRKWDKTLLEDQDRLINTFKKTDDARQLREDFYDLRWNHLERCLTAYTKDLEGIQFPSKQYCLQLLQTKLAFYVTRFAEDSQNLFSKQRFRNGYMVFRFAKAGNTLVAGLCATCAPFIRV